MIVQRQNSAYDRAGSTSTGGMDGCPLFVVSSNQEGACRRMRSGHNRFSLPAAWSALAGAMFVFAPLYVLLATMALDRPLFARAGEKRQKA